MAPANRPERATIGAGAQVVTFDPVFAAYDREPTSDIARHARDSLDDAQSRPAGVLEQRHVSDTRTIAGEGEAIKEDTLARQECRRHAATVDANAPGAGESDDRVEARNDRNQAQEAAMGLSRHIRL